ncbi:MAG: DevC-like transporter permease protein [Verrucomicrobiales bacterium]|nr:DevC-like transporter permease protein [Verrucomicrobiales bacterium]
MAGPKLNIPLSWCQLTWDKLRLLAAVSGIVFAVMLMMMQLGFRDSLFIAAVQFHRALAADLVLVSTQYEYMIATKVFSQRHLYQTLAVNGVSSVSSLYVGLVNWKNWQTKREVPIFLIGFDPAYPAMSLPGLKESLPQTKLPDTVLFDVGSKPDYGPVTEIYRDKGTFSTELNGKKVEIRGFFQLGLSFGADGNLITSDMNFFRLLPNRDSRLIDIGLIRLAPGADPNTVAVNIRAGLPPNLRVMTLKEYIDYETNYWAKRTPVGFIFNLGVLVGFIVGSVIVYQILYTDVADHLSEYATLKAMGYSDGYLYKVVIKEALLLAILGFIPGFILSTGLGILTRKMTLLPAYMTWERALTVLVLTITMCVGSAILSLRKLRSADPADIF